MHPRAQVPTHCKRACALDQPRGQVVMVHSMRLALRCLADPRLLEAEAKHKNMESLIKSRAHASTHHQNIPRSNTHHVFAQYLFDTFALIEELLQCITNKVKTC